MVNDPGALALAALGWVLAEEARANRFLDLTGLTPDLLRDTLDRKATHCAILEFLAAHEPDLLGAAAALDIPPERITQAHQELRR